MLTVYSDDHRHHFPKYELFNGELVTPFESPARVESVLKQLRSVGLGDVVEPKDYGTGPIARVHAPNFVTYLQTAWDQWSALDRTHDILPFVFPVHGLGHTEPDHIDGKVGYFAFDTGAPIGPHTWQAVQSSANCALTAQKHVASGARSAFALCRPPGHHAGSASHGGYCYVNNAAVAAQAFLDDGAKRVTILDIDYHHGNGTQEIFYRRSDVQFVSIHADPKREFPYFLGNQDERGSAAGLGYNLNYPLADYSEFDVWGAALEHGLEQIAEYSPDCVVVSHGVDAFEDDPISRFRLKSEEFLRIGEAIARLNVPTLFVLEGGYDVDAFGVNVVNVLQGFEAIKP